MTRKTSLLLAAVAMLAFAIPQVAHAAKITSSSGVLAPVGSKMTATNIGTFTLTSSLLGSLSCETLTFKGTLDQNDGTTWHTDGNGGFSSGECFNGPNKMTVTTFVGTLTATGSSNTGTANFSIVLDIAGISPNCTLTGKNVPFTYVTGGPDVLFSKAKGFTAVPAACGTVALDVEWTLEIGSTDVILD